jgi:peptide/nickel transport system ATP-binding protein
MNASTRAELAAVGTAPLLQLSGAVKRFATPGGTVHALDEVSLWVQRGETLGLVGESGCGKSTVAKAVMRLIALDAGSISFDGADLGAARGAALAQQRARLQMVFQDPFASLNPRVTVGRILEEPLIVHRRGTPAERREQVLAMLQRVGLRPEMARRYPHEFSGGQRQRIGIARALMLRPELIILDEAVSALDVSIRAQIVNLLLDLREELGVSYLFISHDLSLVRHVADRIAVMYLGRVVEQGPRDALWAAPRHPYTRALMAAVPSITPKPAGAPTSRALLQGELPSAIDPPSGCRFHPRCAMATELCRAEAPVLREAAREHVVACHFSS